MCFFLLFLLKFTPFSNILWIFNTFSIKICIKIHFLLKITPFSNILLISNTFSIKICLKTYFLIYFSQFPTTYYNNVWISYQFRIKHKQLKQEMCRKWHLAGGSVFGQTFSQAVETIKTRKWYTFAGSVSSRNKSQAVNCGTDNCGTDNCGTDNCGTDNCGTDNCGPDNHLGTETTKKRALSRVLHKNQRFSLIFNQR